MDEIGKILGGLLWGMIKVSINQKKLAEFVLWLFSVATPAEIADRLDPALEGGVLVETVDSKVIFQALMKLQKWAEEKIKT